MEPTTGLPLDLLQTFCIDRPFIPWIAAPVHDGQYAWATNGKILVRTESTHPRNCSTENLEKLWKVLIWAPADSSAWEALPHEGASEPYPCPLCGGTGKPVLCPECRGLGEHEFTRSFIDLDGQETTRVYQTECESCNGAGCYADSTGNCWTCYGDGNLENIAEIPVCGTHLGSDILRQLLTLPGPIEIHPNPAGDRMQALPIRGPGWVGVAMPRRSMSEIYHP